MQIMVCSQTALDLFFFLLVRFYSFILVSKMSKRKSAKSISEEGDSSSEEDVKPKSGRKKKVVVSCNINYIIFV